MERPKEEHRRIIWNVISDGWPAPGICTTLRFRPLNAVDAIDGNPDGRIEINAAVDGRNRGTIHVIDNGRGIVEDAKEKIFIPFFTTKKDGSGIGLSVSRQIMRFHNGDLTAASSPGGLTVFTVWF